MGTIKGVVIWGWTTSSAHSWVLFPTYSYCPYLQLDGGKRVLPAPLAYHQPAARSQEASPPILPKSTASAAPTCEGDKWIPSSFRVMNQPLLKPYRALELGQGERLGTQKWMSLSGQWKQHREGSGLGAEEIASWSGARSAYEFLRQRQ